jgi:Phytanoyl-CoA dioxygenase (PhyH)
MMTSIQGDIDCDSVTGDISDNNEIVSDNVAHGWHEHCIADLDLPLHYNNTARDCLLEQVRLSSYPPSESDVAIAQRHIMDYNHKKHCEFHHGHHHQQQCPQRQMLELPSRIDLPSLLWKSAVKFHPLLCDLQRALMEPRFPRLVATYAAIMYNVYSATVLRPTHDVTETERYGKTDSKSNQKPSSDSDSGALDDIQLHLLAWYALARDFPNDVRVLRKESNFTLQAKGVIRVVTTFAIDMYWKHIYQRAWPLYRSTFHTKSLSDIHGYAFEKHAAKLDQDGVVIIENFIPEDTLAVLQKQFDGWCNNLQSDCKGVTKIDGGLEESHLETSLELSRLAVHPYIMALASYYLGKPAHLCYARGYRQEPIPFERYRAFNWHQDLKRRMVKAMFLFTDVKADGQRMDYCVGTHKTWWKMESQLDTTFSQEYVDSLGAPIVPCCGPSGTLILFDPNGVHSGTRNNTERRDQYTTNYNAGIGVFPVKLHPNTHASS